MKIPRTALGSSGSLGYAATAATVSSDALWLSAGPATELVTSVGDTAVLIQNDELDDSGGDQDDGIDNEDFNEISVPLTVVLSVIGGYIVFGTVLFYLWEGWNSLGGLEH